MKNIKYSAIVFALAGAVSNAATMSLSFWGYDEYAGNSPYYSHYEVTKEDLGAVIDRTEIIYRISLASIDLYDRGWGNTPGGKSAYHYMSSIEDVYTNSGLTRSIGWHRYVMTFDDVAMTAILSVDGNVIRSDAYETTPKFFRFLLHDYFGGAQQTVIDDFECRIDGNLVYRQDFESSTLGPEWTSYLDPGTYVASGATSNSYSGTGALVLGANTGGNLFAAVALDLTKIPEPSVFLLNLAVVGCVSLRRQRNR